MFKEQIESEDLELKPRALRRLRAECEKAKRFLSAAVETEIEIDQLGEGEDFNYTLTRAKFEELCHDLFKETLNCVQKALDEAGLDKKDIHEVIMVGGSTRIPKIKDMVTEFMGDGFVLNNKVNADEAIAIGATVQAGILAEECVPADVQAVIQPIYISDVIP